VRGSACGFCFLAGGNDPCVWEGEGCVVGGSDGVGVVFVGDVEGEGDEGMGGGG
jgi:hypothetical protein